MSDPDTDDPHHRRRMTIRLVSGAVAVALVAIAAVVLLTDRHPHRSADAYCAKVQASQSLSDALATGDAQEIRAAVAQFRGAAAVAPVEIQAPTEVLVAYAEDLSSTLDTAGPTEAETRAALAEAVVRLQSRSADVEQAGHAVEAYARDVCRLDPTGTTPVSTG
ncbi:MAG TPA: hypothetical protein VF320_02145 [Acidimicrobiales bacterium]